MCQLLTSEIHTHRHSCMGILHNDIYDDEFQLDQSNPKFDLFNNRNLHRSSNNFCQWRFNSVVDFLRAFDQANHKLLIKLLNLDKSSLNTI